MNRSEVTAAAYIRQRRKCCSSADILLLLFTMTILLCQTGSATSTSSSLFNNDKQEHIKSTDVESVEWQQMKMSADAVLPAEHPVVFKEDYVKQRKDFDETHLGATARKNENHLLTKQLKADSLYKMDTHVIPHVPNTQNNSDNMDADLELNDAVQQQVTDIPSKQQLNKTPKKYYVVPQHKRTRRSSEDEHILKKRTPYIQQQAPFYNHIAPKHNGYAYYMYKSHPVQGNYWNGIDGVVPTVAPRPLFIGQRVGGDEEERVIWDRYRPSVPIFESIFHDSNPANADTSFMTRIPQQQARPQTPRTTTTPSPVTFESLFHDSNPANADLSFLRRQTPQVSRLQQQQQLATIGVKSDKIVFRSSPVDDSIEYDDVYSDASEAQVQQAPPSDEAFCALATISCCRREMNLRSKCFSDWQCKFTAAQMKEKCATK